MLGVYTQTASCAVGLVNIDRPFVTKSPDIGRMELTRLNPRFSEFVSEPVGTANKRECQVTRECIVEPNGLTRHDGDLAAIFPTIGIGVALRAGCVVRVVTRHSGIIRPNAALGQLILAIGEQRANGV